MPVVYLLSATQYNMAILKAATRGRANCEDGVEMNHEATLKLGSINSFLYLSSEFTIMNRAKF